MILLTCLSLADMAADVAAQDPELIVEIEKQEIFEGESVLYRVTLNHTENPTAPVLDRFDDFQVTALGAQSHPKEQMEIFADGNVIGLNDFQSVTIKGSEKKGWKSVTTQKGQLEELEAVSRCLSKGGPWPISLAQQVQATAVAQAVEGFVKG